MTIKRAASLNNSGGSDTLNVDTDKSKHVNKKLTVNPPAKKFEKYRGINIEEHAWILGIWNDNVYAEGDQGPYFVHMYDVRENHSLGNYHRMMIGKKLTEHGLSARKILKAGQEKVILIFETGEIANNFIRSTVKILNKNWFALIPDQAIFECKLIHEVATDLTKEDILQGLTEEVRDKVKSIERCRQRAYDEEGQNEIGWHDSEDIKVYCRGEFPKEIDIYFCPVKVLNFTNPTRRCYNCQSFKHIESKCKSEARCVKCGINHTGECDYEVKCANCNEPHMASSKECLFYIFHSGVNALKAKLGNSNFQALNLAKEYLHAQFEATHPIIVELIIDSLENTNLSNPPTNKANISPQAAAEGDTEEVEEEPETIQPEGNNDITEEETKGGPQEGDQMD